MALPPMDKEKRKLVHEMAHAFNLKSQSEGRGEGKRYTKLTKRRHRTRGTIGQL